MSLLFVDGFDHYDDNQSIYKWDIGYHWSYFDINTPGRFGDGGCLEANGITLEYYMMKWFKKRVNTVIMGFAWKRGVLFSSLDKVIEFYHQGGIQLGFQICSPGVVKVRRGDGQFGTIVAETSNIVVNPDTWYYVEIKVYVHASAGTAEVRINEQTVLNETGLNTRDHTEDGIDGIRLFSPNSYESYYDDLYICDDEGPNCDDFLGECRIHTLFPNAPGNYAQWTPSAGDNFENVDEILPIDNDTTYNETNVSGEIDTFHFEDLSNVPGGTIHGVALNNCIKKTDAGYRLYESVARINGTDYVSGEGGVFDEYRIRQQCLEINPDDSNVWEEADINSGEFGYKIKQ